MNKITKGKSVKGFTIIEVVLVLAIAGLIFLMVFIALPALQRNQRDTQRKNDMSRVQSAINSYQANNRGKIPFTATSVDTGFISNYLTVKGQDKFEDPDLTAYSFTPEAVGANSPTDFTSGRILFSVKSQCDGEKTKAASGSGKVSIRYKLEGGGTYCLNN